MISTTLMQIVYQSNRQKSCLLCFWGVFGRLTHTSNLMQKVSFLPLNGPIAPTDINWMRKQNGRLYEAQVAEVLSRGTRQAGLECLFWLGGSTTVPGAQNH